MFSKRGVNSAIIDLRGNGGGLLNDAQEISGLFIEKGPIVQTRRSDGKVEVLSDNDASITFHGGVVVLVNRGGLRLADVAKQVLDALVVRSQ